MGNCFDLKKTVLILSCLIFLLLSLSFMVPSKKGASVPYPLKLKKKSLYRKNYIKLSDGEKFFKCEKIPLKPSPEGKLIPVNKFIDKYSPFNLKNPLLKWKWVLDNISYESDFDMYGRKDVWQFGKTTYLKRKGDCEDSAILLCDWLISGGNDALVAVGIYKEYGWHAWVVLNEKNASYFLECTGKMKAFKRGPLFLKRRGNMFYGYRACCLFNEKGFWRLLE